MRAVDGRENHTPQRNRLPCRRKLWKPTATGRYKVHVGVESARDGAVDDGLLLLVQQRDQLPLPPNRPLDLAVRVIQKPRHLRLFIQRREWQIDQGEILEVEVLPIADEVRGSLQGADVIP